MKSFVIGKNDAGQRLDKFLRKAAPAMPPALLYKAVRTKRIKRNGARCQIGDKLLEGDLLELYLSDELFEDRLQEEGYAFLEAKRELRVVYEDAQVLLVDKPPGLLVHGDAGASADTLLHRVQRYLYETGAYRPEREQSFAPALCNRIDRNTGGLVIAAKTFEALQVLGEKLRLGEIEKYYLCEVQGLPAKREALLEGYHSKDQRTNTVQIHLQPRPGAKPAKTRYRVLAEKDGRSLLEVELLTGRSHQIRAQLAAIGHPLVGDVKYGGPPGPKGRGAQALYSYKIVFRFRTPAGALDDLAGRAFVVEEVPFARGYFPDEHRG